MCRTCVRAARRQANRGPADRAGGDQLMTRLRRTGLKIDDPLTPTAANDQMPTAAPWRDEEHAAGPSGGPLWFDAIAEAKTIAGTAGKIGTNARVGPRDIGHKEGADSSSDGDHDQRRLAGLERTDESRQLPATGRASRRARLYLGGTPAPDWAARHCRHRPPPRRARRRDRRSRRPSRRRSHRGASCRTSLCLRTSPRGSDGASEAAGTL